MVNDRHKINRLSVEIQTTSLKTAHAFKSSTPALLENYINPIITRYFDQLSQNIPNGVVRLEKLAIAINISEGSSKTDIANAFEIALRKELSIANTPSQIDDPLDFELQLEHALMGTGIISTTSENSLAQALFHFIEKGQFPWWKSVKTFFSYHELKKLKQQPDFTTKLKKTLAKAMSRNRLIYQFEDREIAVLILAEIPSEVLSLSETTDRVAVWNIILEYFFSNDTINLTNKITLELIKILNTNSKSKERSLQLAETFLTDINQLLPIQMTLAAFAQNSDTSLHTKLNKYQLKLKVVLGKALKEVKIANKLIFDELTKNLNHDFVILNDIGKVVFNSGIPAVPLAVNASKENFETHQNIEIHTDSNEDVLFTSEEEIGLVVANAGLLLLHPFLKTFFGNLNVLEENDIPEENYDLAVHLLHYLACKKLQPYEHELIFEKFICNIPIHHPIQKKFVLNEEQINACETLLKAVLGHWTALKTRSTDVLRNEFLSREGKLALTKDHEKVYIQRKTADILLESVPWNLGLIKFPWKKNFVFLEW